MATTQSTSVRAGRPNHHRGDRGRGLSEARIRLGQVDGGFLAEAAQGTELLDWFGAPSAGANNRNAQAHVPWGNNAIYFDTAGCCNGGTQRINKGWNGDEFLKWHLHFREGWP